MASLVTTTGTVGFRAATITMVNKCHCGGEEQEMVKLISYQGKKAILCSRPELWDIVASVLQCWSVPHINKFEEWKFK